MRRQYRLLLCAAAAVALGSTLLGYAPQRPALPHRPRIPDVLSRVSSASPFPPGCAGAQSGTNFPNTAVEPYVAVDPVNPAHLIGVWQQDRWSNGGANGLLAAVSMDRGRTWTTTFAHFSQCSGGTLQRASDPWVTISPDGTAHQIALALNAGGSTRAVLVSRSSDGGFTWSEPVNLLQQTNGGEDKETITADPTDSHYVYAVWDRPETGNRLAAWFARTTGGGATWEPSRIIYNPANARTSAHQIVVLPNGMLLDVFVLTSGRSSFVAVIRSADHGVTWSAPITVSGDGALGVVDAKTQAPIRTGAGIPSSAVDPGTGTVYITWEDARFSGNQREGVALARSTDGGLTWSAPVQVNQAPDVQAFTPSIAVSRAGTVAITYYDFRKDTADPGTLLANCWRIVSADGGNSWTEAPVAGPFDLLRAPLTDGTGLFLGDYQGLAASADFFVPFFAAVDADSPDRSIPTSIFALPVERAGDMAPNGHIEINHNPRPYSTTLERKSGRRPPPRRRQR